MTRARALGEMVAVLASVAVHFLAAEVLHLRIDIAVIGLAWIAYLVLRAREAPQELSRFGITRENLCPATLATGLVLLAGSAAITTIGAVRGCLGWHWHLLVLLALYPLWGLVQQLLVFGVFLRAFEVLVPAGRSSFVLVPLSAILFGAVHVGDRWLVLGTAALAVMLTPIWLRWRNLWPLGVCHGWLWALFYCWALGRSPFL